jgi:2',3'-cyclic-nucleotide 2'-phosphodiesterase (5'-nucleotidase family)
MGTGDMKLLHLVPFRRASDGSGILAVQGDASAGPVARIGCGPGISLPPALERSRAVRITLLHFNDLHGHVCRFTNNREAQPVFSRLAAALRDRKAACAEDPDALALAVSAGDDCGGAVFDELLGRDSRSFVTHAAYRLYSAAGVDAACLGNHDLDRGDAVLAEAIRRDARFPVLAANLTGSSQIARLTCPAAIVVAKGVRVGLIGLVTRAEGHHPPECGWRLTDPVEAAANLAPAVRPLCDVLIILSHLGLALGRPGAHVADAGDIELARALPPGSVNLIVGGHTHDVLDEARIVNGIPIVQAGSGGHYLGEVTLCLAEGKVAVEARLVRFETLPAGPVFEQEQVRPLVDLVRPIRARRLGRVANDRALARGADSPRFAGGESPLANFVADGLAAALREHGRPVDFAMVDGASITCGLAPGRELTYGEWFEVMPYADVACIVVLSGRQLKAILDDNALRLDRPPEPHVERGFLHFSAEVRYVIERGPNREAARCAAITIEGAPIEEQLERTFRVAVASFVRGTAAGWEAIDAARLGAPMFDLNTLPRRCTTDIVRGLLVERIEATGGVLPDGGARCDGRLRLAG